MRVKLTETQLKKIVKKTISEDDNDILDKILHWTKDKLGIGGETPANQEPQKVTDVPNKADTLTNNVDRFFKTLENINEPIKQQEFGTMKHQDEVEATQVGLVLLGYELPRFGVDGLFGPETAKAVSKFKSDNQIKDSSNEFNSTINESSIISPVDIPRGFENTFGQKRITEIHPGIDIGAKVGTPVKAIANGVVTIAKRNYNSKCGTTLDIKYGDGLSSRFCHLSELNVQQGDTVTQGQVVGKSGGEKGADGAGNSGGPHLHFTLLLNGKPVDPMGYLGKSVSDPVEGEYKNATNTAQTETITKELALVLIPKLKSRGVTPEDLNKYIDPEVKPEGSDDDRFTDLDLSTAEGSDAYKKICDNYIATRNASGPVTGSMLLQGALQAWNLGKYLPPELALAQVTIEGGLANDYTNRPHRTKNPFNVGNTEKADNPRPSYQDGINLYYRTIAKSYMTDNKNAGDLIRDFKGKNGRYAPAGYENELVKLLKEIRRKNASIYADINKSSAT
jgi:murein DD-endopeptidase MepM/ murein hydrolase activator NlpD